MTYNVFGGTLNPTLLPANFGLPGPLRSWFRSKHTTHRRTDTAYRFITPTPYGGRGHNNNNNNNNKNNNNRVLMICVCLQWHRRLADCLECRSLRWQVLSWSLVWKLDVRLSTGRRPKNRFVVVTVAAVVFVFCSISICCYCWYVLFVYALLCGALLFVWLSLWFLLHYLSACTGAVTQL